MTHTLKTWPEFFQAIKSGDKTFECRRNDRGFQKGDYLQLLEYDKSYYTHESLSVEVTYVLTGEDFGIKEGFCVMGIKQI